MNGRCELQKFNKKTGTEYKSNPVHIRMVTHKSY